MSKHEDLKPHIYLFDMMADKTGHNLEVAILEGKVTAEEVIEGAMRCSECTMSDACEATLPETKTLDEPFKYCRNRSLFADR